MDKAISGADFKKEDRLFTGPFFIVGMPRSGTKLLRGLLNEHPLLGIPTIETHFLPFWARHWSEYGDLSNPFAFQEFYRRMLRLPYFLYMEERGGLIKEEVWYGLCGDFSVAGVFEALLRHDGGIAYDSGGVWGDKTPAYIQHIRLLKEVFPNARIIHIIRDVRDYCLSVHKAWGKNMIRAAQRWSDDVQAARATGRDLAGDYMEVKYEDLLENPSGVLMEVCRFLGVEYESRMVLLSRPTENIGDAKGMNGIKKDNVQKYKTLMDPGMRTWIEAIAAPLLNALDYPVEFNGKNVRIGYLRMSFLKALDAYMILKFRKKARGILNALRWCFESKTMKS